MPRATSVMVKIILRMCEKIKNIKEIKVEQGEKSNNNEDTLFIGNIELLNCIKKEHDWIQTMIINNHKIDFKIDTGAQTNVISLDHFIKLGLNRNIINKTVNFKISTLSNENIPIEGICTLECLLPNNGHITKIDFVIVKINCTPLLGLASCKELKLIERNIFTVLKW